MQTCGGGGAGREGAGGATESGAQSSIHTQTG
jgi:hypothetical protein